MNKELIEFVFKVFDPLKGPAFVIIMCILILLMVAGIGLLIRINKYKKTLYFKNTKKGFFEMETDRGSKGEYLTYKSLRVFESDGARFLFNVYIPKDEKSTSELDALMLCSKGIFVFESKYYSGWIFGNENNVRWTQSLPGNTGSVKYRFPNPITQNKNHIKHLKKYLKKDVPCYSVVVFSNDCKLKHVSYDRSKTTVVCQEDLEKMVRSLCQSRPDILCETEIEELYLKLYPLSQLTDEEKEKHVEDLKNENSSSICPFCQGTLIVRTSKRGGGGQFWGCSNYPRCRYTRNI